MAYLRIATVSIAVTTAYALPTKDSTQTSSLIVPKTAVGASIPHTNSFASFSFEPAFWVDFFGNASNPNQLTFKALDRIHEHGGRHMIFDPNGGDVVRTTSPTGGVWRTTVGPGYYKSCLEIATGLAVASLTYQPDKVAYLELGNEPTNYNRNRWNLSTQAYVKQWKEYTASIDTAVNTLNTSTLPQDRWWASSATTDNSGLEVRPAALIPAGINSAHQVNTYSIHSYAFSTCDPKRAALATIKNILNHTELTRYCDSEIYPSALAALNANSSWSIGEFNSVSCSGAPNVTDTFAQALWVVDSELLYATRNATSTFLHQGATLALQSNEQVNTPGKNGSPGFSTYSMLYPRDSELRGPARTLPSFLAQLFMAEAFAVAGTRVRALQAPEGVDAERFAAYAFYVADKVAKVALVNMNPFYANSTADFTVTVGLGGVLEEEEEESKRVVRVKRMTAPFVDSKDNKVATWAGQSFPQGEAVGKMDIEVVEDGVVSVRGSEAVLVFFDEDVYGV
ncbi:glycoside hydrolase [Bipolaris maydis]|nr:glycoside hydrolase [Bipolaris maydis]